MKVIFGSVYAMKPNVGDVVVATKVYGYELGNESEAFLPRSEAGNISHYLVQRARAEARKTEWRRDLRMPSGSNPGALVAPIISSDNVVRSTRDQAYEFIRERYRDVRAIDSGAYGVVQAASSMQVDALIVCGIADLLDAEKYSDEQRGLAVAAAGAFAFEVLTRERSGVD